MELGVPTSFWWNSDQVADWIEALGFPQYKDSFRVNSISGRNLILIDASTLPTMGIQDFNHIKVLAKAIRDVLGLEEPDQSRSISLPPRSPLGMYLERKSHTGPTADRLKFTHY